MAAKAPAKPEVEVDLGRPDPKDAEPVLKVNTKERTRPTIDIDDKLYELKTIGDFGIGKQQILNRDGREFYQLWTSEDELDENQQKRLKFLLERMYAEVLDAPKSVARKLNDSEKADVVLTFTLAPLRKAMQAAAQAQETEQKTETVEAENGASISTS